MTARILALVDRLIGSKSTGRSMVAEFGPTAATLHPELASFSDADLIRYDPATLIATADALAEAKFRTSEMPARSESTR